MRVTLSGTRSLSLWLQLPKYSNNSSKLLGQTTQLWMCLEILHLPSLINFLSWIWIAIMSQLTSSNANEMQKRLVVVVVAVHLGSCSNVWILTRITHWAHSWLFIVCKRDWLALSPAAFPTPSQESRQDKFNLIKTVSLVWSHYS